MSKNYDNLATDILKLVGGKENVVSLTHCITRLRFVLKEEGIAQKEELQNLSGVISVIQAGGQYQVVIGNEVDDVYQAVLRIGGIASQDSVNEIVQTEENDGKKGNFLSKLIDIISSIFMPCMPAMVACGLIKAICIMLTSFGIMSATDTTYTILYALGDGFFYFMPFFLASSAAKKFGTNSYLAMCVAGAFVYPNITELFHNGTSVHFLGIPVIMISYTTSVLPIIFAVYVMSKWEKLLKKFIPKLIAGIIVPLLTLIVIVPISFIVIGPFTDYVGQAMAHGYSFVMGICPPATGFIFGGLWAMLIMFGMHWAFVPIGMNNLTTLGYDTMMPITFPANFSQAGACLGIFLKTKNKKVKELAMSCFLSVFIGGISEPAIYGLTLKYKRPFFVACFFNGIGGMLIALAGGKITALIALNILTLPAVGVMPGGIGMLLALLVTFIGTTIATMIFGYSDKMIKETEQDLSKEGAKEILNPMNVLQ